MTQSAPEVRPDEAYAILQNEKEAVLLDVRSRMEHDYVGHPTGAVHVSLMEPPQWTTDPTFVSKVRSTLSATHDRPVESIKIFTLCRSGKRSRTAAELLIAEGFASVYNIAEGFEGDMDPTRHRSSINGWRYRGLPWEQT